jgi:hypothetical protein
LHVLVVVRCLLAANYVGSVVWEDTAKLLSTNDFIANNAIFGGPSRMGGSKFSSFADNNGGRGPMNPAPKPVFTLGK